MSWANSTSRSGDSDDALLLHVAEKGRGIKGVTYTVLDRMQGCGMHGVQLDNRGPRIRIVALKAYPPGAARSW